MVRRALSMLLMLLLLLSQQVTLSHAVSHWAPAAIAAGSGEQLVAGDSASGVHACALCVAAAQYAAALPVSSIALQPPDAAAIHDTTLCARDVQAAPALAFRSRAPPLA